MKNMMKYFGLTLVALLFSVAFTACEEKDEIGSDSIGLSIKVFSPTKVVAGQTVTINGSGFGEVTEVVFPGGIAVSNFELVSNEMIRVITPAGVNIAAEGEKLAVRTASDVAESAHVMTQGNTQPRAYSAEPGEEVKAKSVIRIFGQDMEFVDKATFIGSDDEPIYLTAKDFYRIATNSVSIRVPNDVKEGLQVATFGTIDGKTFELPEYKYAAAAEGGHWETKKILIWENDGSLGEINWSSEYRFANAENATGEECAIIDMDNWSLLRNGTFYVDLEGASPQIRVTSGWWSTTWTGNDIFPGDERLTQNEDGSFTLEINLEGDPLLDVLDQQHFLLTGSGYTPKRIYTVEQTWVEGDEGHMERKYLWTNDGSLGDINWSSEYRFANEENASGEECHIFTMDEWDVIRNQEFYVEIEGASPQIRVTSGWWSTTWTGNDIFPGDERLAEQEEGKYVLTVKIGDDPLIDVVDVQHLLFTGSGYKVNGIFIEEWVEGGGSGPKETVIWENDGTLGEISWSSQYRFANEENPSGEECWIIPMDQWEVIRTGTFYLDLEGEAPQIRVTSGWWSTTWTGNDIFPGDDLLTDNGDGKWTLQVNLNGDALLDVLDVQHLLFTGSGYTPLKLYYK